MNTMAYGTKNFWYCCRISIKDFSYCLICIPGWGNFCAFDWNNLPVGVDFQDLQPFSFRKGANSHLFNYVLRYCYFRMSWCKDTNEKESIQHLTIGTLTRCVYESKSLLNQATIVRVCCLRKLLWATRGARNSNLQVAFTHVRNVCS